MKSSLFNLRDLRTSSRSRVSLCILFTSLICFGMLGFMIYRNVSTNIIEKCKSGAMDIAKIAADEINGDDFEKIRSESDEEYTKILEILSKYEKAESIDYAYTMKRDGKKLIFVVDADPSAKSRAPYGEEYEMLSSMYPAFSGEVCCDRYVTSDKWGSYFSAYAPVMTSDGNIAGIVGVDTQITGINHQLGILKLQIILQITVFFALCFLIISNFWTMFSRRDMLTGILNYDSLVESGNKLRKRGTLSDYTAVQLNIRNFKYLNSKIGTGNGDILLQRYASLIASAVYPYGLYARTGSDNFIMLIKNGREEDIIEKLSESRIDMSEYGIDEKIQISVRCGIYRINENDSIQDAINYTSVALKNARVSGNNYIVRFEKSMLESIVNSSSIIADFRRALAEGEFHVFYQPKVNISTNDLCGAEALVRWIKDGRIIPPSDFIPVLENEGLITRIDFFVFETVCRNIRDWIKKGIKPVPISSNFSKLHLADPDFADRILEITEKYKISHELIEIELTESSGYSDYDALTKLVSRMNREHIRTSIDDFGTGYSSLSMLKDINVDVVKIDKSFLDKTGSRDVHQEKMLENVIRMINDLDRTVICEGIETSVQLDFLKHADCSVAQGYFYDKPLRHAEFELRLKNPHYEK